MVILGHHRSMLALVPIAALVLLALAIYFYGADSRIDEVARRRRLDS